MVTNSAHVSADDDTYASIRRAAQGDGPEAGAAAGGDDAWVIVFGFDAVDMERVMQVLGHKTHEHGLPINSLPTAHRMMRAKVGTRTTSQLGIGPVRIVRRTAAGHGLTGITNVWWSVGQQNRSCAACVCSQPVHC